MQELLEYNQLKAGFNEKIGASILKYFLSKYLESSRYKKHKLQPNNFRTYERNHLPQLQKSLQSR